MENLYGSIDLTKLGNVVRQHPELVRNVQFRDGSVHKILNININQKYQTDQYGNVASVKVGVRRSEERQGVNYYFGELKISQHQQSAQSNSQAPASASSPAPAPSASHSETQGDELPF